MSPNPSLAPPSSSQQSQRVSPGVSQTQASSSGKKKRARNGPGAGCAGSGSDVDGGAGSGSDGGTVSKKLKLNPPGVRSPNNGTPHGSRAGSPANPGGKIVSGSRASSPEGIRGKYRSWRSFHQRRYIANACIPQQPHQPVPLPLVQSDHHQTFHSPLQPRFMLQSPPPESLVVIF